jgi:integrase
MKSGREHRVPLSDPAIALLKAIKGIRQPAPADHVFTGSRGPLGHASMFSLLRAMGRADLTVHGFRSSFRDWTVDTGRDESLAEAALAHAKGDATVRAYRRSDVLERRRVLMDEWAGFCLQVNAPAQLPVTSETLAA